ncbi:MAG TPA: hypothetical protein PLB92_03870 [Rhodoglobus sp.]|nr:hypothetical protein [Rhodoglobus sp.]
MLLVESMGEFKWSDDNGERLVTGCDPCDAVMKNTYKITVKRCAPSFAAGPAGEAGAPPVPADRTALALDLVAEAWSLAQAIRCCIAAADECRDGRVIDATHALESGCKTFSTTIEWEHTPCC